MVAAAFSHWIEPSRFDAGSAPTGPLLVQVKLASGLIDYPTGKSAMVCYAVAEAHGVSELVDGLCAPEPVLVRVRPDAQPAASLEQLLARFRERFGAPPLANGAPT